MVRPRTLREPSPQPAPASGVGRLNRRIGGMQATEQITRTVERMGPGRAVVASLLAHGVDTVFGLDGSHVIQVFDALADAPSIAPLTFKHENNAAIAAEVYGRLTGRPGVVLVTAGPGATNSLSGTGGAD